MILVVVVVLVVVVLVQLTIPGPTLLLDLDGEIPMQTIQFLDMFLRDPANGTRIPARRGGRFITPVELFDAGSQTRRQPAEKRRPHKRFIRCIQLVLALALVLILVNCLVAFVVVLVAAATAQG